MKRSRFLGYKIENCFQAAKKHLPSGTPFSVIDNFFFEEKMECNQFLQKRNSLHSLPYENVSLPLPDVLM